MGEITRPLRVGYVGTRPIPARATDTQQMLLTTDALARAGVDVEIITPRRWRDLLATRAALERDVRRYYGVSGPFRLAPLTTVPPSRLEVERLTHALVASIARARRYDLVHTRSRTTLLACAGLGRRVVFETYRRVAEDQPSFGRMLGRAARRPHVLGVIAHSEQCAASVERAGVPPEKILVAHNGYDPAQLLPPMTKTEARAQLGLDALRPVVSYTGNLQRNKGLDAVLEIAGRTPDVQYLLVGGTDAHRRALELETRRRGLANVDCPGWFPAPRLKPYLYAADVLLVPPTRAPLERYGRTVLPIKVFSYLAAGRPILAPRLPDIEEVLEDDVNARLVSGDRPAEAVNALREILEDDTLARRLSRAARVAAQGLTWEARAERIVAQYHRWLARASH